MKKFYINGTKKLSGEINISGSKNSILSILPATLLSNYDILIKNVPNIKDVNNMINIFKYLGSKILFINSDCYINNSNINKYYLPSLSKLIRSSILIISPLLIRFKISKTFLPGGCNFCYRPIDYHIDIFNKLGIKVYTNKYYIKISLNKKYIESKKIKIKNISFGATINSILLTVLSKGVSIIENISIEPEVLDTINFLNSIGANIFRINNKLYIKGVNKLNGGIYSILPDRIETGTFLLSALITRGEINCVNTNYKSIINIVKILTKAGAIIKIGNDYIYIKTKKKINSVNFSTRPYPGFPTDLQPIFTLLNILSNNYNNYSIIEENVFSYRFTHVDELIKMGAKIKFISKNKIICLGAKKIFGNYLIGKDLRSSMCLILAGLCAIGQTVVIDEYDSVERGYENILFKLNSIGADIIVSNI